MDLRITNTGEDVSRGYVGRLEYRVKLICCDRSNVDSMCNGRIQPEVLGRGVKRRVEIGYGETSNGTAGLDSFD